MTKELYLRLLNALQVELVKLQNSIINNGARLVVVFEGRYAAGKGGVIHRFSQYLMPRYCRVVALPKPSDVECGQWYFQRYLSQFPTAGEIVLFDRSWYNRAVVEPVNGFCTEQQYALFMRQVNDVERMLIDSGIMIVKFWLDISEEEQVRRFKARRVSPLKQWKISPVDAQAQALWGQYSHYQEIMLKQSSCERSPWAVINGNDKKKARLEAIRYLLSSMRYEGKCVSSELMDWDPGIVQVRYG